MTDLPRRDFLAATGTALTAAPVAPAWSRDGLRWLEQTVRDRRGTSPGALAEDEEFWIAVRRAFPLPPDQLALDNGNTSPIPGTVLSELLRYTERLQPDPVREMDGLDERVITPVVRPRLAQLLGVPSGEIAIVRNATEALDTVLLGVPLRAGDEVVCSAHDYWAMLDAIEQRQARDGIVVRMIKPPAPASPDQLGGLYEAEISERTRLVLVTHASNLTGQLYPIRRIVTAARRVGAEVVLDGAQTFGALAYQLPDLGVDYFGASCHKWLMGPVGTGVLWMKPALTSRVWPLFPPPPDATGIGRYEAYGTVPTHLVAALEPALQFHDTLGIARKTARLRELTTHWRKKVEKWERVTLYTPTDEDASCGLGTVAIAGAAPDRLAAALWDRHRILVQSMGGHRHAPEITGIRISPNVFTLKADLDRFVDALEPLAKEAR